VLKHLKFICLMSLCALFGALTAPQIAHAQNAFERLVMPGPLIEGHAKYEADCTNCHAPFSQKVQKDLCLGCHRPVAADIKDGRGFHGMRKDVAANDCRHCHAEHKGRAADIIQLDKSAFDHVLTNFALIGKHTSATCESCHKTGKKFREASSACVDCHRSVDPHKGQLSTQCANCHTPKSWTEIKGFDHGKTKFALTGSHADVSCKSCHAGERYKALPMGCIDCHRQQDAHQGRNGPKCDGCHKTTKWFDVAFDHDTNTKFPLLGKHQGTGCEKCHKEDPRRVKLAVTCISCHAKDDAHKGQLGKDCLNCHGEGSWKKDVKFDHALSRFPLQGKHADAKCEDCHKTKLYKDAPVACSGCHSDKTSHDGRLGTNCAQCHTVAGWKSARFDHDSQTKFKLTGRHATTTCYGCHKARHVQSAALPTSCYNCHKSQDRHHGAFGRDCGKCHTTSTFSTAYIRK
jgi:hypothetical protein